MVATPEARSISTLLPQSDPAAAGIDLQRLDRLFALVEKHIAEKRYPGAQIAMARGGKLVAFRSFGNARLQPAQAAEAATVWPLYSQTKVITTATVWLLVERGLFRFADKISDHVPEFAKNGKGEITLFDVLTHQAGYPNAPVPEAVWTDHDLLRRTVCDFSLEWTPGSKVQYHGGTAHWTAAVLIEAVTGRDFREVIRTELLEPLGLADDLFVGVPEAAQARCADMHALKDGELTPMAERNTAAFRAAGVPGGGGYASAQAYAAFYQMMLAGGALNGVRVLSPRMIAYVTRNHTGERVDDQMGMPMHRGLGPHVRGLTPTIRGLGAIASPTTYGHGGAGSSYSWADPESGVSFTYLTNGFAEEPWHTARLDTISTLAHAAIL